MDSGLCFPCLCVHGGCACMGVCASTQKRARYHTALAFFFVTQQQQENTTNTMDYKNKKDGLILGWSSNLVSWSSSCMCVRVCAGCLVQANFSSSVLCLCVCSCVCVFFLSCSILAVICLQEEHNVLGWFVVEQTIGINITRLLFRVLLLLLLSSSSWVR